MGYSPEIIPTGSPELKDATLVTPEVVYRGKFKTVDVPFGVSVNEALLGTFLAEELGLSPDKIRIMRIKIDTGIPPPLRMEALGASERLRKKGKRIYTLYPRTAWANYMDRLARILIDKEAGRQSRVNLDELFVTKRIPSYLQVADYSRAKDFLLGLTEKASKRVVLATLSHESWHAADYEHLRSGNPAAYFWYATSFVEIGSILSGSLVYAITHGLVSSTIIMYLGTMGSICGKIVAHFIKEHKAEKFAQKITGNSLILGKWRNLIGIDFDKELVRESLERSLEKRKHLSGQA